MSSNAQVLSDQTPPPRQVRVVGRVDMVRHSTRSFGLVLDDGQEVRGVLLTGPPELLQESFGHEITVLGRAIYRPSGTLLRIDAAEILPEATGRQAFSKIPSPLVKSPALPRYIRRARTTDSLPKSPTASFFGSWPGEETDQDLLRQLEEIRS